MQKIVSVERSPTQATTDRVRLDHDQRTRRRMLYTTENGATILLDMPRTVRLRDGDALRLEDGVRVRVEAMPEALLEIAAPSQHALVRLAWHLGNRHLPTQLIEGAGGGTLRIRHDHVIAEMIETLGGSCRPVLAPFDPEGGAYDRAAPAHRGHHDHGAESGHG